MKSFGFSRLCQPRKYGEAELPLNVAIDVLSILADGCASTAWVCAVYTDHAILSSLFSEEATDEVWGKNPEALISAGYHPMGKVERTNNGWQLSPFFWHPIDKHDFSKLQTEVIGIQRRSTAKPVPTGPPPTMTTC